MKHIDYSDSTPDVTLAYDSRGRLSTRADGAGVTTLGYHGETGRGGRAGDGLLSVGRGKVRDVGRLGLCCGDGEGGRGDDGCGLRREGSVRAYVQRRRLTAILAPTA